MITTGSKFFFGAGVYGLVAALAYALGSDNEMTGLVVLATFGVVALLLGGITFAFRDAAVATEAYPAGLPEDVATVGRGPLVSPSAFPLLAAFGTALVLLGLVFSRWYTIFGAVLLVGVLVEWVVQSWTDRASDDAEFNQGLRRRMMHPIELPVLGTLAVGLVIFGFSRVMLAVNENAAIVAFVVVAALVLVVASAMAGLRRLGGEVLIGTLVVGGIIVLTAGVISAVQGERTIDEHAGEGAESESVADVADLAATFELQDGALDPTELPLPRAVAASITFTNHEADQRHLVIEAAAGLVCRGVSSEEPQECATAFVEDGQTTFLTFQFNLPGEYPFAVVAEGGGEAIEGTISVS